MSRCPYIGRHLGLDFMGCPSGVRGLAVEKELSRRTKASKNRNRNRVAPVSLPSPTSPVATLHKWRSPKVAALHKRCYPSPHVPEIAGGNGVVHYLRLPAAAVEFPVLERLSVARCGFNNLVEVIRQCPCLRVLELDYCWDLGMVKVHSPTIEKLVLHSNSSLGDLDIVAPVLKQFRLEADMDGNCSVLFSAPMVEDLSWSYSCDQRNVGIGEVWCLRSLYLRTEESAFALQLSIDFSDYMFVDRDLIQQIAPLPQFSVLEIYLAAFGHVFGAVMLNLLGTYNSVLKLKVVIRDLTKTEACSPDCPCDESPNWRSQTIPLLSLEEIEIDGFEGTVHEVDFLKLLFRCATLMKRMIVRISRKLFPSNRGYKKMCSIFEANPSVKYYVYRISGWY